MSNKSLKSLKQEIFNYISLRLGGQIIDLELDPEHFEIAYTKAIGTYRQRGQNAHEESYVWMELQEGQNVYTLPTEVTEVRQVFRRTFGAIGGDSAFDPFSSAVINTYVMNLGGTGGLATWELYTQKLELAARMFGGFMNYTFNSSTKKISLVRNITSTGEVVLLWCYNLRPEVQLLVDIQISQWIKDYAYAVSKQIIGEARSKFGQLAGPQGGVTLNGDSLKNEALVEMEKLEDELKNYVDGSQPLTWIIG